MIASFRFWTLIGFDAAPYRGARADEVTGVTKVRFVGRAKMIRPQRRAARCVSLVPRSPLK